jgi:WD40 repeat protein
VIGAMVLGRIKLVASLLLLGLGAAAMAAPLFRDLRASRPPISVLDKNLRGKTVPATQPGSLVGVAFMPDGQTALSARTDGQVQLWDSRTGQPVRSLARLKKGTGSLRGFAIAPDGARLAAVGSTRESSQERPKGSVWIWSTDRGDLLRQVKVDSPDLECIAFSPEGASLATGGHGGIIQLWDVSSGEEVLTLRLGTGVIRWLAFAPDGMTLAASDEASGFQLWSLAAGRPLGTLSEGSPQGVLAPAFSSDGRLLAFGTTDGEVILWDRLRGQPQATARFEWSDRPAIAFAPDSLSLAVTGGPDGKLSVLDTATAQPRWTVSLGAEQGHSSLAYAPDGQTLLCSRGSTVSIIDVQAGRPIRKHSWK